MARGDEIEPGAPQPTGWASGDYQERPEDDERLRLRKPQHSGAVTAAGVIAIVWGVWTIVGGACLALMPLAMPTIMAQAAKANPNDPNLAKAKEAMDRISAVYLITMAAVQFLMGLGYAIGGIGTMKRSNAARLLTIALSIVGVVIYLGNTAYNVAMGLLDAGGMVGTVCGGLFAFGFAVLTCVILLNPRNAAEFRS